MALDYEDDIVGIERDNELVEDYAEICEDSDDDDIEMAFPEEQEFMS